MVALRWSRFRRRFRLSLEDLQSVDDRIGEGVVALLDNRASMNARQSEGGTATIRTLEQIENLKGWVSSKS